MFPLQVLFLVKLFRCFIMVASSGSSKVSNGSRRKEKRVKPANIIEETADISEKRAKRGLLGLLTRVELESYVAFYLLIDALAKHRDFTTDLDNYIDDWISSVNNQSGSSTWKFNKVLQEWALKNWQSKSSVPTTLFKKLLPYFDSIRGSARDRLLEIAERLSTTEIAVRQQQQEATDEAQQQQNKLSTKISQSRAKKIIAFLSDGQ